MLYSILIPTLEERRAQFGRLRAMLEAQINAAGLQTQVEVCTLCDNREQSLGAKRNQLLRAARGEFIAFVDDDDDVSADYIAQICNTLRMNPNVDCLGITGIVYFRGTHPHRFVYSLEHDHYFSRGGVYYRPPYILNPIRHEIAQRFAFESVSFNEDVDWAMRIARARALRSQVMLTEPIYIYYSRRHWLVQAAIDATEWIRHPLGLQFVNRLRLKRWWHRRKI